ncbi:MAG: OsmC family protein, partial [Gemmatimonadota bacterium]
GNDEGPMPLELLGASVGTCVALYVQQFCESRGLPYEGMRVEVRQIGAQGPSRVGRFDVRIVLKEDVPPQQAVLLERVARSCPAHNTLVHGAEVAVRIEQETPVAS